MNKKILIFSTIILVIVIDQLSKFWVKTSMSYGESFNVLGLDWARIHFVENEGMAFGLSYGGVTGKYILTSFRIVMVAFLAYLLRSLYKDNEKTSLIFAFSLILAGAVGNIIDCIFYGQIFSESFYHGELAKLVPVGTGYGPWLQGKVVDMFYFPMLDTILPSWFPIWGGQRFEFFRNIFNVADSAITVGVFIIILFNRSFLVQKNNQPDQA
jgi:signal peptidase II